MNYPIVIHKDRKSDYGVTVPDLPGCFSAGTTIDEALLMAREAIELHLEGLIEEGMALPRPGRIETYNGLPDYRGGTWAVVAVDEATLRVNARRINISIPERVLDAVDRFAEKAGDSRSGLLVRAVTQYMGREGDESLQPARRGRRSHTMRRSKRATKTR